MIDLHCHILPAMDDGARDMEESLSMLKIAAEDGVTAVAATPHFHYGGADSAGEIKKGLEELRGRAGAEGIPLKLMAGADIRLTYELIDALEKRDVPTINGSRYFLLELPDLLPPNLETLLFTAEIAGFVPIITHPERNYTLLSTPDKLQALRASGALFQITAMSITGDFGTDAQMFCSMMFRKGLVDFVASDAHGRDRRRPVLSGAHREARRISRKRQVHKIFFENPEAVVADMKISI